MKCILFILIILCVLDICRLEAQIAVIAHPDVDSDGISSAELRDIYTGDLTFWTNGQLIIVCDLNDDQGIHDLFYDFIAISSSRVKSIWMKRMLSGKSDPPLIFNSGTSLSERIATLPGAIGFVDEKDVIGTVKVLMVIEED